MNFLLLLNFMCENIENIVLNDFQLVCNSFLHQFHLWQSMETSGESYRMIWKNIDFMMSLSKMEISRKLIIIIYIYEILVKVTGWNSLNSHCIYGFSISQLIKVLKLRGTDPIDSQKWRNIKILNFDFYKKIMKRIERAKKDPLSWYGKIYNYIKLNSNPKKEWRQKDWIKGKTKKGGIWFRSRNVNNKFIFRN